MRKIADVLARGRFGLGLGFGFGLGLGLELRQEVVKCRVTGEHRDDS